MLMDSMCTNFDSLSYDYGCSCFLPHGETESEPLGLSVYIIIPVTFIALPTIIEAR